MNIFSYKKNYIVWESVQTPDVTPQEYTVFQNNFEIQYKLDNYKLGNYKLGNYSLLVWSFHLRLEEISQYSMTYHLISFHFENVKWNLNNQEKTGKTQ